MPISKRHARRRKKLPSRRASSSHKWLVSVYSSAGRHLGYRTERRVETPTLPFGKLVKTRNDRYVRVMHKGKTQDSSNVHNLKSFSLEEHHTQKYES